MQTLLLTLSMLGWAFTYADRQGAGLMGCPDAHTILLGKALGLQCIMGLYY